ncbi:MAG: prepilin-type cleavage/methylation domain-containing protein [Cyanobacteriota bacterium]|nr:prepilin-type cleavage/methylation domain-containing protein [Cyanobacteriota bacterium]
MKPKAPHGLTEAAGTTLAELLMVIALVGLVAGWAFGVQPESVARQQVETAMRRLVVALERGRTAAERSGSPCALELGTWGWRGAQAEGAVPCPGADTSLDEGLLAGELLLSHTFSGPLRFSTNGLAIDGGTALVGAVGTDLVRCLVVSPPLGVMRVGRYAGAITARPQASACQPDAAL